LQKKEPKNSLYKALVPPHDVRRMSKRFCFFFQKEVISCCQRVNLSNMSGVGGRGGNLAAFRALGLAREPTGHTAWRHAFACKRTPSTSRKIKPIFAHGERTHAPA
jgi:hypothetical protein